MVEKGDTEMRPLSARSFSGSMAARILGLSLFLLSIASTSFADPYWSFGFSGGSAGITGITFSLRDYGGYGYGGYCEVPLIIERYGPPCGYPYGYYPRHHWGRDYHHYDSIRPHMNRPDGQYQGGPRPGPHNQNNTRPNGYQQNVPGNNRQSLDEGGQNRNMSRPTREQQHQWEMSRMNMFN
ncbi:MAG TPA: hypothetical protein PLT09_09665 [Deltaproteobacteria bacterium]|nr:hypothetical protein [Deltaproteobacteria bacterium]